MTRPVGIGVTALLVIGGLWYLRDPAWLATQTTGLRAPERAPDGSTYRWSGGHASFFVPSDARQVRIPVSTIFDSRMPRGDEPMMVTFTIDDVRAGRVLLSDPSIRDVTLDMPPRGSRHVRRVDVRTSLTRDSNHGVKIGGVMVTQDGREWRPCCFSPQ
jgi:hypothetical protein